MKIREITFHDVRSFRGERRISLKSPKAIENSQAILGSLANWGKQLGATEDLGRLYAEKLHELVSLEFSIWENECRASLFWPPYIRNSLCPQAVADFPWTIFSISTCTIALNRLPTLPQ